MATNGTANKAHRNGAAEPDIAGQKRLVRVLIERTAKSVLGVTSRTAFKRIDAGELRGTIVEAELKGLRDLLHAN
jgi:hypothetical protein